MRKYLVILAILLLAAPAWGKNLSEIYPDTTPAEKVTLEDTGDNTEETEVEGAIAEIYGLINAIVSFDWDYDYGDLINTPTIVDWTVSQAPAVIHADNYTDTDTTYSASDFNHDDLSNITGTAAQYNHPTDAQMTVIGNTSNTNTGDETSASIGVLSDNLDDTDASVEWEDAVGLDSDGDLTDEVVQDKVGAMVSGNTETGITATYQDDDGTIDFVVDSASATADGIARLGEVPSGATVPVSPATGDMFLHTPTGRTVLMQYDGSNWQPIRSYGTMTMYVDGTDGTNAVDKGGAVDAGAFTTIQYTIDMIPGTYGGNVTINVAAGTYAETVTIQGKNPTGPYTIEVFGTLTTAGLPADNCEATGVQGTGATQGTVVDTGVFTGHEHKLITTSVNSTNYRLIDSVTADTATIVGTWPTAAPTSGTYQVYDFGTTVNRFIIYNKDNVSLYYLKIGGTSPSAVRVLADGNVTLVNCSVITTTYAAIDASAKATVLVSACYFGSTSTASTLINFTSASAFTANRSKFVLTAGTNVFWFAQGCPFDIQHGNIIDGVNKATTSRGIFASTNAIGNTFATAALGYNKISRCGVGISAVTGAMVTNTSANVYTDNTTDEDNASGASFGYID